MQPGSQRERTRRRLKAIGAPCAICGKPIDYDLDWWTDPKDGKRKKHPYSFEYDHIQPRSLGGSDGFDNAQPAHRICNERKGNRVKGGKTAGKVKRIPTSRLW